jgi:hypothetical protein
MADTGLFLIMAGMTVLLVMSLFAVITMSAQDAAGAEPPDPARPPRLLRCPPGGQRPPVTRPGPATPRRSRRTGLTGLRVPADRRGDQRQSRPACCNTAAAAANRHATRHRAHLIGGTPLQVIWPFPSGPRSPGLV